jgi:hypothetical protein
VSSYKVDRATEPVEAGKRQVEAYLGETSRRGRAKAERILARYPELDAAELAELLHWYRREASSMDVALLASNEGLRERYRRFRLDHVERFSWKEKSVGAVLAAATVALIAMGLLPEVA